MSLIRTFFMLNCIFISIFSATENYSDKGIQFIINPGTGNAKKLYGVTTGCPKSESNQICSGSGQCDFSTGKCLCSSDTIGKTCQYRRELMTCTNQRHCVQCRVHLTGPFGDNDGCEEFCRDNPLPLILDRITVKRHEVLCSFIIDSYNSTNICRFYFKLVNLPIADEVTPEENTYNNDVFIIAQQDLECDNDRGRLPYFPYSVMKGNKELVAKHELINPVRNNNNHMSNTAAAGANYATLFVVLLFIALPFIACIASCIQHFRSLPCGLCNQIRRPSSSYLRNVRTYPGLSGDII